MRSMNCQETFELLSAALAVDSSNKKFNSQILHRRGVTSLARDRLIDAANDFTLALRLDESSIESLLKRANVHFKLSEFENCVIDLVELLKIDKNNFEAKRLLTNSKKMSLAAKRSWNDILGVKMVSSKSEVKKAFHKLSLLYHPDKNPQATAVEKKKLERKLREINEAYDNAKNIFE